MVKTDREPRVRLYDLAGRFAAELTKQNSEATRASYTWTGDCDGQRVPPGIYIVQIEVDADARTERVHKTVHVVY